MYVHSAKLSIYADLVPMPLVLEETSSSSSTGGRCRTRAELFFTSSTKSGDATVTGTAETGQLRGSATCRRMSDSSKN
jgi:hypothetical protein